MFVVAHKVNSAPAVRSLQGVHVEYVELDVRLTRGSVVLSHFQKVVWAAGWLERDNARVRLREGPPYDASIDEITAILPADVTIVFDPKDRESAVRDHLADVLTECVDPARHIVSSRRAGDLRSFARAGFRTWQTVDTPAQIRELSQQKLAADGVTVRHRALTAAHVSALHEVTDTVVAWTVNNERRAVELAGMSVDGITTDSRRVIDIVHAQPHR
jgi:glycerophosphoryl diester phosphodiesterase